MAATRFLVVYIERKKDIPYENLERRMNSALDWYRLREHLWILYTNNSADTWQLRLEPFREKDGSVFICRLDVTERQGWMDESFWKWFRSAENRPSLPRLAQTDD